MRVIPVIDILGGVVVRAVAGRRSDYRPLESRLTDSIEPATVAKAMFEATGATELYVADLDSITTGSGQPSSVVQTFIKQYLSQCVWLDCGIRDESNVETARNVRTVIGSETVETLVNPMPDRLSTSRPILSLDLMGGKLISKLSEQSPLEYAAVMIERGYRSVILLNLSEVGMNLGSSSLALARELKSRHPDIELYIGGGIRDRNDLEPLEQAGVDGVLVSSAIHTGRW